MAAQTLKNLVETDDPEAESGIERKLHRLEAQLLQLDNLMVAYSGGVDSAFLAATAHRILGSRMLAVLADSPASLCAYARVTAAYHCNRGTEPA